MPAYIFLQCVAGSQAKQTTLAMPGNEGGKTHCQHALLNLGSTHAHFGHVKVGVCLFSHNGCAHDVANAT